MGKGKRGEWHQRMLRFPRNGPPCTRCRQPTVVCWHTAITPRLLAQSFYYSRWYYCVNAQCQTTNIMLEVDKVWNKPARPAAEPEPKDAGDQVYDWNEIKAVAKGLPWPPRQSGEAPF